MPRTHRILVVDDNAALADNLREILSDAGYAVTSVGTSAAAREAATRGFDVALVDLRLPDGDGIALARELKDRSFESEVVLLTGFATVESAAAAVRAGACAFLVKPCSTPELLLTVQQALRHVQLQADKRELARRAQTAEKLAAVGTLTAGLSHEIRNPLNAASLQLAVLERRVGRLPETERAALMEPLTLVRDEIRRLDHTLEDFLQFARPREFSEKPTALIEVAGRVLNLLRHDAEKRGLLLERALEATPPVLADSDRLTQVFMNLALNALDASPRGGAVRVSVYPTEHHVVAAIEDAGPGIPLDVRERIFEPFFTTKPSGSGLGLSIVHAIVTQHGGTIAADSSELLGGARFTLRFPLAK